MAKIEKIERIVSFFREAREYIKKNDCYQAQCKLKQFLTDIKALVDISHNQHNRVKFQQIYNLYDSVLVDMIRDGITARVKKHFGGANLQKSHDISLETIRGELRGRN
ncbi:MAG: hypothetical protein FWF56_04635 [Firmicutes bacterium]|nr:hypothetical protein [Bacillota bacterium]MCL1953675.1 hypothetical protein [Bacillota bacterium]